MMCKKYFAILRCVLLLLVTSSSKSQQISTNNEEKGDNLTRFEVDTDSITNYNDEIIHRYDLYEKFTNNTQNNGMLYKFRIISTKNDHEDFDSMSYKLSRRSVHNREDNDQILMNSHTNLTNVNHKDNFTSQEVYENLIEENNFMLNKVFENSSKDSNESINIIPYEMCHNITCILLCCSLGNRMRMDDNKCIPEKIELNFFPNDVFTNDSLHSENKRDELFHLAVYDSCQEKERFLVDKNHQYDYKIFANGSIYLSHYKILFKSTSYCLAAILERGDKFEVTFCSETYDVVYKNAIKYAPEIRSRYQAWYIYAYFRAACILFLVPIILVYSILPELRNVHGFMLCNYCTASSAAHLIYLVNISQDKADLSYPACITLAFSEYFCVMSSHFWLSAMSFNMWRIFRGFYSLQKNARQPEKRKLWYYVIFAYGVPFILVIVCVIVVDLVSDYSPKNLRPEFWLANCWYFGKHIEMDVLCRNVCFYGPENVCVISSICLSISAALKIKRYDKDIGLRLTDSESRRYNDNKKWFNLYLKLFIMMFIVMGIYWAVVIIVWSYRNFMPHFLYYYLYYLIGSIEIAKNICIFIIFVCKKKIKLMLLKRFGCGRNAT